VSRFFSSTLLKELARKGQSALFARLLNESGLNNYLDDSDTVGSVFDKAFNILKNRTHRHEYVYKAAIAHKILLGTHSLKTASMLTEFRVRDCKADVAILNGTGTVYEIKSERDSLSRLEKQIKTYRQVFASVNVIVGQNHLEDVVATLPSDVGIMTLGDRYRIHTVRKAIDDPGRTNSTSIFDAITLKEAATIMNNLGLEIPAVPNTLRYTAFENVFRTIDPSMAHRQMVGVLKTTRRQTHLEPILAKLPSSLQSAALTTKLKGDEFTRLIGVMPLPIADTHSWIGT